MKVWRLQAFPNAPYGGNKAGVVLEASELSDSDMQRIASEVGYSETAFVTPGTDTDFTVRFFTPTSEVDLCGHATIATFNLLRDQGIIQPGMYTQRTKAGVLRLDVRADMVFMEQNTPRFFETLETSDMERCFKEQNIIDHSLPIQVVSTGMKEIFVPIQDVETLHSLTPNINEIRHVSEDFDAIGLHAFALADEVDAYGRNFAPVVGISEESATGTSNGALSCYLYQYVRQSTEYTLRQGFSMNQPSEIHTKLDIENGTIVSVWVGGTAILVEKD